MEIVSMEDQKAYRVSYTCKRWSRGLIFVSVILNSSFKGIL